MKKIPTVFVREYENHKVVGVLNEFTNDLCKEAFLHGDATIKVDGAACAIINGEFYKRFDAKKGRRIPDGAIPCSPPDPVTGHHPFWVPIKPESKDDKWFIRAFQTTIKMPPEIFDVGKTVTFEAVGAHFNGNPYRLEYDLLVQHGTEKLTVGRTYEDVRTYLALWPIEGLVFWMNGQPVCKIKRSDFGFPWPVENATFRRTRIDD